MSIKSALYLLGLVMSLCKASQTSIDSVSPQDMSSRRTNPHLKIDLNKPPAIEHSHASTATKLQNIPTEGAEGTPMKKKKVSRIIYLL